MTATPQADRSLWPPYLNDEQVQEALEIGDLVATWNREKLYGVDVFTNDPGHMAMVAFSVVHEHQNACLVLVRSGLLGSAMALMRPSFEAFVRGLWLQYADDGELERFLKGKDSLNPEKAIKLIVQRSGVERYKDLTDMWLSSKQTLHNYVHHSYQSLIRRSGEIEVPNEEVFSLLHFSSSMATHASFEIMELMDRWAEPDTKTTVSEFVKRMQLELVATLATMGLATINEEA